jgi:1-acyl-sn-glycerol-3-phosphate acyltransferase
MAVEVLLFLPLLILLLPSRTLRIRASDRAARILGKSITWVAGIKVVKRGERRLESRPPSIFLTNHSSTLDFFVLMSSMPDFTCGVGKKEMARVPFIGQLYALSGHLLIDRRRPERAHQSLAEAADFAVQEGFSIWLTPEGTRSRDGALGPFKKGFVHLALATGFPVTPVLLHGASTLWPMGTWRLTPGCVEIEVLEPVDTLSWSLETIDTHVDQLRGIFVEHLERGGDS